MADDEKEMPVDKKSPAHQPDPTVIPVDTMSTPQVEVIVSEKTPAKVVNPDDLPPHPDDIAGRKPEHGAQVHLTGEARAAARGALHGSITGNTIARDAAVGRGEAADGMTPDGSTPDGRLPPDVMDGADQAVYGEPGEGEGKKGSRPGDEEMMKAEQEAADKRAAAKKSD